MPQELRRLIFKEDELRLALSEYISGYVDANERGFLVSFKVTPKDPCEVAIMVQSDKGKQFSRVLGEAHVAAALIAYCKTLGIPIPKRADKSLKYIPNGMAMDIKIMTM
jgi:hypothetical protein